MNVTPSDLARWSRIYGPHAARSLAANAAAEAEAKASLLRALAPSGRSSVADKCDAQAAAIRAMLGGVNA